MEIINQASLRHPEPGVGTKKESPVFAGLSFYYEDQVNYLVL